MITYREEVPSNQVGVEVVASQGVEGQEVVDHASLEEDPYQVEAHNLMQK